MDCTCGCRTCVPARTCGLSRTSVALVIASATTTSNTPSVRSAPGAMSMPPPYRVLLPTATSVTSCSVVTPSRVIRIR